MGIEYKIAFDPAKVPQFDGFLRASPYFESYDAELKLYNLRFPGTPKGAGFPDAYASLMQDGVYFCDNLTNKQSAAVILRSLIDEALLHSDSVIITEP